MDPDPARSQRTMKAMLGMKKIGLAAMKAAADGKWRTTRGIRRLRDSDRWREARTRA